MQLHPIYATVTRPVYQDREHNLYLKLTCPECGGEGTYEVYPANPSERCYWETCDCCRGDGEVYEDISEDEIINS